MLTKMKMVLREPQMMIFPQLQRQGTTTLALAYCYQEEQMLRRRYVKWSNAHVTTVATLLGGPMTTLF